MPLLPWISSADLQHYLRLPDGSIDEDTADIALDGACQVVRDYCDQNLETTVVTDALVDGSDIDELVLPNFPIQPGESSEPTVTIYADGTLVDEAAYDVDLDSGIVTKNDGSVWNLGTKNVKVSYTYGYDVVPASVRLMSLQVAIRIYEFGMYQRETVGALTADYVIGAGSLTELEKEALYPYRRNI